MRSMGLMAMTAGSFYLWLHFRSLPIFERLRIKKGMTWVLSAVLAAALLLPAALCDSVLTGFYLYLCLCYVLTDAIWFVVLLIGREKKPLRIWRRIYAGGLFAIALAGVISVGGYFNAKNIRSTEYEISLNKSGFSENGLRVAMISDVHLGSFLHGSDMPALVERVNALSPDLILLCGDIYEERTTSEDMEGSLEAFSGFRAALGAYYVLGNHEYYAERRGILDLSALFDDLYAAGITPLRDERVLVGGIQLVGRNDVTAGSRKPLQELLRGADMTKPVFILDHQPRVSESAESGADLQLSGHTHAGQLFPAGQLAQLMGVFPVSYGLRAYGDFRIIVSSGAGVWGFPMRVGSPSEIVLVTIKNA
jgi:predicted MPP superfamily phosphohydrolase